MVCYDEELESLAFMYARSLPYLEPVIEASKGWRGWFGQSGLPTKPINAGSIGLYKVLGFARSRPVLTSTVVLSSWIAYKTGIAGYVCKKLIGYVPGYDTAVTVVSRVTGGYEVVAQETVSGEMVPESARDNSRECPYSAPAHQASVGFYDGSKFVAIGCALRFQPDWLVMPDHVLATMESLGKLNETYIVGRQSYFKLDTSAKVTLASDAQAFRLSEKDFARIGMSYCRAMSVMSPTDVKIVGPFAKGTAALLRDSRIFGRVEYDGSTFPGYSGASYSSDNACYGMHTSGGTVNWGYSASYLSMRLTIKEAVLGIVVRESSEDWLRSQFKAGVRMQARSAGDPGFVEIKVNGEYHAVTTKAVIAEFGSDWNTKEYLEKPTKNRSRDLGYEDDFEAAGPSGEAGNLKTPGASSLSGKSQESGESNLQSLTSMYLNCSRKQRESFRRSQQLYKKQK